MALWFHGSRAKWLAVLHVRMHTSCFAELVSEELVAQAATGGTAVSAISNFNLGLRRHDHIRYTRFCRLELALNLSRSPLTVQAEEKYCMEKNQVAAKRPKTQMGEDINSVSEGSFSWILMV